MDGAADASPAPEPMDDEDTPVTHPRDRSRESTVKIERVGPKPSVGAAGHTGARLPHDRAFDETEIRPSLVSHQDAGTGKAIVRDARRDTIPDASDDAPAGLLHHPMSGWLAAALLTVLLVVFTFFGTAPVGIDPQALTGFYDHLEAGRFSEAEAAIESLTATATATASREAGQRDELAEALVRQVKGARAQVANERSAAAMKLFGAKRYEKALPEARAAAAAIPEPAPDLLYLIAECERRLESAAAAEAYATFLTAHPEDPRRDDALFWQAEALAASGQIAAARQKYAAVVAMPESDFKTSAARRLAALE